MAMKFIIPNWSRNNIKLQNDKMNYKTDTELLTEGISNLICPHFWLNLLFNCLQ